jgi:hypothetical protein
MAERVGRLVLFDCMAKPLLVSIVQAVNNEWLNSHKGLMVKNGTLD